MKIRNGFVSNSSSSSFCIYGASFDSSEVRELLKNIEGLEDADLYELREHMESKDTDLSFWTPPDYGMLFIGKDWSSVKDAETGKEFKEHIEAELEKLCGKKVECGTHSEAWYG